MDLGKCLTHQVDVALAGGTWRWLEEFANVFIGERRFCLAAEPYRSIYSEAIPSQIRDLGAGVLKLDCVVLHCTSSAHGHRPGRHSVEPMVDALIAMIAKCLEIAPNLRVIWYWGFRSPWFLWFGDMVFDKGLLMEAATPASSPLPTTRQAMSLNVDQSIRHARFLPLELQDSLGVWIGDVAWCNRVGRTEWREAFLLDSMRGSDLVQLWGDLDLFDLDDRAFLRDALRWIRRDRFPASTTIAIGGDPWRAEAYGYARAAGTGTLLALINPDSQAATVRLDRDLPGWPAARAELVELYPFPGRVATPGLDRSVELDLMPFELRLIRVVDGATVPDRVGLQSRPTIRPTRPLDLGEFERSSARPAGSAIDQTGTVRLPVLGVGDLLFIAHRFERDGQWTYDPEPHHLVSFGATIDGFAVHQETVPGSRDRNGPGAAWVIRRIPAGPAWSGRDLELSVGYRGPDGVEMTTTGAVVAGWWLGHRRRFEDLLDPGRSAPADQGQGRRSAAVTG